MPSAHDHLALARSRVAISPIARVKKRAILSALVSSTPSRPLLRLHPVPCSPGRGLCVKHDVAATSEKLRHRIRGRSRFQPVRTWRGRWEKYNGDERLTPRPILYSCTPSKDVAYVAVPLCQSYPCNALWPRPGCAGADRPYPRYSFSVRHEVRMRDVRTGAAPGRQRHVCYRSERPQTLVANRPILLAVHQSHCTSGHMDHEPITPEQQTDHLRAPFR